MKLVCVSKFHSADDLMEAYDAGERIFGENRVQELTTKQQQLPSDIQWHFIGHLQTNKIKYIIPFVSLIHGVDSLKLLKEINRQAEKTDKIVSCLLQVHIAQEESKFGFSPSELIELLAENKPNDFAHVRIVGLMGMASFTDDEEQIRNEFQQLKRTFEQIKTQYFVQNASFCELSMGMSQDYHIAIAEGSTMVRIGTSIFGERG